MNKEDDSLIYTTISSTDGFTSLKTCAPTKYTSSGGQKRSIYDTDSPTSAKQLAISFCNGDRACQSPSLFPMDNEISPHDEHLKNFDYEEIEVLDRSSTEETMTSAELETVTQELFPNTLLSDDSFDEIIKHSDDKCSYGNETKSQSNVTLSEHKKFVYNENNDLVLEPATTEELNNPKYILIYKDDIDILLQYRRYYQTMAETSEKLEAAKECEAKPLHQEKLDVSLARCDFLHAHIETKKQEVIFDLKCLGNALQRLEEKYGIERTSSEEAKKIELKNAMLLDENSELKNELKLLRQIVSSAKNDQRRAREEADAGYKVKVELCHQIMGMKTELRE